MPGNGYVANGRVRSWFFPFFLFSPQITQIKQIIFFLRMEMETRITTDYTD